MVMRIIQRMCFASVNRQKLSVAFVLHFAYIDVNH